MISLNDNGGSTPRRAFSAQAVMRSLEQEMAKMQGTPSDAAQQLYYDAMEAESEAEQFTLLEAALKLDPGNVDALLVMLRHQPTTTDERIGLLRKIVAVGEHRLGAKAFKGLAGVFWGAMETRPYMRARGQLAEVLHHAGRTEEAVAEWEAMLELNPNDNQGVRYLLLASYLALQRLDGAARLFAKFEECPWNTVFAWGRVLERWLARDNAGAVSALAVARKQNAHTEAYLKGRRRLPKNLPEAYAPGSKDEAVCFAETLLQAWGRYPEALQWLAKQSAKSSGGKKPGGA